MNTQPIKQTTVVESDELVPLVAEIDVKALIERTNEMLVLLEESHGSRFPFSNQNNRLYDKDLEGRAFVIVSQLIFTEIPDDFKKGENKRIVRFLCRIYNPMSGELGPVRSVQLAGGYVLSQVRGMTDNELIGSYLWTLARDKDLSPYQRGDGWEYPRRLAIYDAETDSPVSDADELSWAERVESNAKKVAAMSEAVNNKPRPKGKV